jgi:tetraacyldisaccharide 4'-kinase
MKRPWLVPLNPLYAAALALRNLRLKTGREKVRRLGWPVVSIGNLSTGGSGKTPLTIALANALAQRGLHVDVLSHGYGRRTELPTRVDPNGTAEAFGDEPLLIARETGLPVYVASQRYEVGSLVETTVTDPATAGIHLLDDGFQHRQLHRDVDILLLDRRDWGDRLLPAGNLREPRVAARRATVIAIPAEDPELEQVLRGWGWGGPIWRVRRKMDVPNVGGPVVAFCGIARPEQFFAGLEAAGVSIATRIVFADHHSYTPAELARIAAAAGRLGAAAVITTEKDRLRLGTLVSAFPESLPLMTARLRSEIDHEERAVDWLVHRLELALHHPSL